MKISIDSSTGVVTTESGNGVTLEGKDYTEAPFDKRWDDLYAVIDEGTGQAALTYEAYRDTGFYMKFFRHSQDDNIFMHYSNDTSMGSDICSATTRTLDSYVIWIRRS